MFLFRIFHPRHVCILMIILFLQCIWIWLLCFSFSTFNLLLFYFQSLSLTYLPMLYANMMQFRIFWLICILIKLSFQSISIWLLYISSSILNCFLLSIILLNSFSGVLVWIITLQFFLFARLSLNSHLHITLLFLFKRLKLYLHVSNTLISLYLHHTIFVFVQFARFHSDVYVWRREEGERVARLRGGTSTSLDPRSGGCRAPSYLGPN